MKSLLLWQVRTLHVSLFHLKKKKKKSKSVEYETKDGYSNLSRSYFMEIMPVKIAIKPWAHKAVWNQPCSYLHATLKMSLKQFFRFKQNGAWEEQNEYSLIVPFCILGLLAPFSTHPQQTGF